MKSPRWSSATRELWRVSRLLPWRSLERRFSSGSRRRSNHPSASRVGLGSRKWGWRGFRIALRRGGHRQNATSTATASRFAPSRDRTLAHRDVLLMDELPEFRLRATIAPGMTSRLALRVAAVVGVAVLIGVFALIGNAWWDSRIPETYSVMSYGTHDFGGGSEPSSHVGHGDERGSASAISAVLRWRIRTHSSR